MNWKVLSSFLAMSTTRCIKCWPAPSRTAQRRSEAMTSSEVTAVPSLNLRPSRSSNVQVFLSSEGPHFATICGLGLEIGVDAEQRVVEHGAVVGGHVGRGPDRIEHGQVAVHDRANG